MHDSSPSSPYFSMMTLWLQKTLWSSTSVQGAERDKLKCQFKRISLLRKTAPDTSAGDLVPLATKQAKNTVIALSLSFL